VNSGPEIPFRLEVPEDRATDVNFHTLDVRLDDGVHLGSERRHTCALHKEPIDSRQNHAVDVLNSGLDGNVLLD